MSCILVRKEIGKSCWLLFNLLEFKGRCECRNEKRRRTHEERMRRKGGRDVKERKGRGCGVVVWAGRKPTLFSSDREFEKIVKSSLWRRRNK